MSSKIDSIPSHIWISNAPPSAEHLENYYTEMDTAVTISKSVRTEISNININLQNLRNAEDIVAREQERIDVADMAANILQDFANITPYEMIPKWQKKICRGDAKDYEVVKCDISDLTVDIIALTRKHNSWIVSMEEKHAASVKIIQNNRALADKSSKNKQILEKLLVYLIGLTMFITECYDYTNTHTVDGNALSESNHDLQLSSDLTLSKLTLLRDEVALVKAML